MRFNLNASKQHFDQLSNLLKIAVVTQETAHDYVTVLGGIHVGKTMLIQHPDYLKDRQIQLMVGQCNKMIDDLTRKIIDSGFTL